MEKEIVKNNLEHIHFESVKNLEGICYADIRKQLAPKYILVYADILKGYIFLFSICCLLIVLHLKTIIPWSLLILAGGLFIGYSAAYIALFTHEASHYNLHPNKRVNDIIATLFLCLPFGLSIKCYRKIHWQHHLHLGTQTDTEISYFNHLNGLFILETMTGIHLFRTIFSKEKRNLLNHAQLIESRKMLIAGGVLHAGIICMALAKNQWVAACAWITGFGIFFPLFASIRQLLEHRDELADSLTDYKKIPHGKISRIFYHTMLSGSFGAAGFTRHMIHHWDPQISYTRMKDVEAFLEEDQNTSVILKESKTSYLTVFKNLYNKA